MLKVTKKMNSDDLVYGKHLIYLVSNFLTEVTNTDELYKTLN